LTSLLHHGLTKQIHFWFRKNYLQEDNDFVTASSDRTWLPNFEKPGGKKLPDFAAFSYNKKILILGEAKTYSELIVRTTYGDVVFKGKADKQILTYLEYLNKKFAIYKYKILIISVPFDRKDGVMSFINSNKIFKDFKKYIKLISNSID